MRKDKQAVRPLKELLLYCRRYLPAILISLVLGGAGAVFSVIGPDKIADMVNVIEQGLGGTIDLRAIGCPYGILTAPASVTFCPA